MAIFGIKKRKDEKLQQGAEAAKALAEKKSIDKTAFNSKIKKVKAEKVVVSKVITPVLNSDISSNTASVIIRPRITEKSGILSQNGVYTFVVSKRANKAMVSKAITALYKVVPTKVSIINTPIRNVFVKGRRGTVAGIKKAVVTLKKGDKIDFV